ncbi:carboxypeptidase-like regulatory domain-containing protein [Aequorivita marina]|uniref:carboxypeptidase-like regulatory domain-containing protein n=1 Tax=Aequorivita marina TaxID=3073654 RepID=UPI002874AEC6|nr:carboxypeptidase-like regulatory domain-containing protein [Aequorivita sp. S2608]MDS1299311.1 carboxypeptidase-like regulatory domain-containing protein [Aequorivita sp. S2608]
MKRSITYLKLSLLFIILVACSEDRISDNDYGVITGKVVAEGSNTPLENVRINTSPVTSTVFTDAEGNFRIENVAAGEYSVGARLDGYLARYEPATALANKTVNVIFEMEISTVNNRPPSTPVLISPTDNQMLESVEAIFVWSSIDPEEDPLTFSLELRNDQNEEVLMFEDLSDTIFRYPELMLGTQYYWQVSSKDEYNPAVLSPVGTFSVAGPPVDNRFLFVRNIDGNNVIFSADEEGNEFQLTSVNTNSYRPRRNVAADRIAYLQTTGAQADIYTMKRDGTDKVKVTSNLQPNGFNLNEINISWPENSDRIYFPNLDKLYSIRSSGQGLNQVFQTLDGSLISEIAVSENSDLIVLKTNNLNGYDVSFITINKNGDFLDTLQSGLPGAASGLDLSVTNNKIVYSYDVSEFQSSDYRRLDSRMFTYDISTSGPPVDISNEKPNGTNDLEPIFAPNEAFVIYTNTSNDGISRRDIYTLEIGEDQTRTLLYSDAYMPDWE